MSSSLGPIPSTTSRSECELPTHIPGWATVPPKLLRKIWNLEYVDMWELLPESWRLKQQAESCCRSQRPRRGLVTNLALWTECYAMLVAVLASRFLKRHPTPWHTSEPSQGQVETSKGQLGRAMIWRTDAKLQTRAPLIGLRLILPFTMKPLLGGQGPFPTAASA